MVGLVIRNTDNSIKLDMTSSISQMMGSFDTGTANGSTTVPSPPAGRTFFYAVVPLVDLQKEKGHKPGITISGNTASWIFSYATNGWGYFSANCRVYYGYF